MDDLGGIWQRLVAALESTHPAVFFLAMALLPLGPFPASLLFISAGVRFGVVTGFVLGMAALSVNMTLAYHLARRLVRRPLEAWIRRRGYAVPEFGAGDEIRFLLLFRITPGMPLFVQNYVLGVSGIRFRLYLGVSMLVQIPYVLGFAWVGQSLTQTSAWRVVVAVAAIVAIGLIISLVRRRLAARGRGAVPPGPAKDAAGKE